MRRTTTLALYFAALFHMGCDVPCLGPSCFGTTGGGGATSATGGTGGDTTSSTGGGGNTTSSGGTGGLPTTGGGGTGATTTVPSPCSVDVVTPAQGTTALPISASMTVHWTLPIDPATLAGGVDLVDADGVSAPATVTLQDASTALVTPVSGLRIWQTYELRHHATVKSTAGDPCGDGVTTFTAGGPIAEPRELLPVALNSVTLLGGKALGVSAEYRGVQLYTLSGDQASLIAEAPTGLSPQALVLAQNGLAFAPAGYDGIARLHQQPFEYTDSLDTPGNAADVAAFTHAGLGYVAVADIDSGLRIVSAGGADGLAPLVDLGAVPAATGKIRNVEASPDGTLIAARNDTDVLLLASPTPAAPATFTLVADIPVAARDLRLSGARLFVSSASPGLLAYDVSAPATPVLLATGCDDAGCSSATFLAVSNGDLLAATGPRTVARFLFDDVAGFTPASTYVADSPVHGADADAANVYLATEEGLVVYPREAAAPPPSWKATQGVGIAADAARIGDDVYSTSQMLGLLTLAWPAGGPFERVDQHLTPGTDTDYACGAIVASGTDFLVGDARGGSLLFTTAPPGAPEQPALVAATASTDSAGYAVLAGDIAYVCDASVGVQIVSLAGAASGTLDLLATLGLEAGQACSDLHLAGDRLFVVGGSITDAFFDVADVSNPAAPVWLHTTKLPDFNVFRSMAFAKGRFYVTGRKLDPGSGHGYTRTLAVFDLDAADTPSLTWTSGDIGASKVTAAGGLLFVTMGNGGVDGYRAESQAPPTYLGTFPTSGTANLVRVEPARDAVMVLEGQGGIERFVTGPLGD